MELNWIFVEKDTIKRSIITGVLSYLLFYHMIYEYISNKVHLRGQSIFSLYENTLISLKLAKSDNRPQSHSFIPPKVIKLSTSTIDLHVTDIINKHIDNNR